MYTTRVNNVFARNKENDLQYKVWLFKAVIVFETHLMLSRHIQNHVRD